MSSGEALRDSILPTYTVAASLSVLENCWLLLVELDAVDTEPSHSLIKQNLSIACDRETPGIRVRVGFLFTWRSEFRPTKHPTEHQRLFGCHLSNQH